MTLVELLQSPEFWVGTVLAGFFVSLAANFVSAHSSLIFAGNWLRPALAINVAAVPILMALKFSAISGGWIMDVGWSICCAIAYLLLAQMRGRALLALAFWMPNLLALAAVFRLRWLGAPEVITALLSIYPLIFVVGVLPLMVWAVPVHLNGLMEDHR